MKRPTLLDLAKANVSLGVKGRLTCPACDHVWDWRFEHDRQFETGLRVHPEVALTQEQARWAETGFMARVFEEVLQHFADAHPDKPALQHGGLA